MSRPQRFVPKGGALFEITINMIQGRLRYAYAWVVAEYAHASERLRAGDRLVTFPEGTFPPGLPFVDVPRGRPP